MFFLYHYPTTQGAIIILIERPKLRNLCPLQNECTEMPCTIVHCRRERWHIREARLAGWRRVTEPDEICFVIKRFTPPVLMDHTACTGLELLSCELLAKWRSITECTQNTGMSYIIQERNGSKLRLAPCRLSDHASWACIYLAGTHLYATLEAGDQREYRQRDQMPE